MSKANLYQQRPADGIQAESPLHHAELDKLAARKVANAGVTLREKKFLGHLTLRGDAHDPAFAGGVHQALGLELPVAWAWWPRAKPRCSGSARTSGC